MTFKKLEQKNPELHDASSDEFEAMLNESFAKPERKLNVGDRIEAEILSQGPEFVIVNTETQADGFVPSIELQNGAGEFRHSTGDKVELFVTKVTRAKIFLSANPTEQNLAEDLQEAFEKNMRVEGKITGSNSGGFEVEVLGKRAFCPMGQLQEKRIETPEDFVGRSFEFKITKYEKGGRDIVLSRKKIIEEERSLQQSQFSKDQNVGDKVKGTVTRIEPFGAFIDIGHGLEGLAHISELSWTRVKKPEDVVAVGDVVDVQIKDMKEDGERLKISLTLKDSSQDPWQNPPAHIKEGQVVKAKITRCMPFGAFAELAPGMEGLIPISHLDGSKRVNNAEEVVSPGQEVGVLVTKVDLAAKRVSLSIKDAAHQAASLSEAKDLAEYAASASAQKASQSLGGSLADKLQAALDSKKG